MCGQGGALCRFSFAAVQPTPHAVGNDEVISVATVVAGSGVGDSTLRCAAPPLDADRLRGLSAALPAAAFVQVSLNGAAAQLVDADACGPMSGAMMLEDIALAANRSNGHVRARCYAYFDAASIVLAGIHPLGGPHAGGTTLTVRGSGLHAFGAVGCLFGPNYVATPASQPLQPLVAPATLLGPDMLRCMTPPNGDLPYTGEVSVRLTLNGADILPLNASATASSAEVTNSSGVPQPTPTYTFYNAAAVRATVLVPNHGGALGSTLVTVHGTGFRDYGGLLCRFGGPGMLPVVNATLIGHTSVMCRSPQYVSYLMPPPAPPLPLAPGRESLPANVSVVSGLPPLPATLAVRVLLNGEAEDGVDSTATGDARFRFGAEPCSGNVTLRGLSGAFAVGVGSAHGSLYSEAPRECEWILRPTIDGAADGAHTLVITVTHVQLRSGFDSLLVTDGDDRSAAAGASGAPSPPLMQLPDGEGLPDASCARAQGACLQVLLARTGIARVRLSSLPRADGTASHLALTYAALGPPVHAGDTTSLRPALSHHPDTPHVVEYAPVGVRRAEAWMPGTHSDSGAAAASSSEDGVNHATSDPSRWGAASRVLPMAAKGVTEMAHVGSQPDEDVDHHAIRVDRSGHIDVETQL